MARNRHRNVKQPMDRMVVASSRSIDRLIDQLLAPCFNVDAQRRRTSERQAKSDYQNGPSDAVYLANGENREKERIERCRAETKLLFFFLRDAHESPSFSTAQRESH
jgi:hypothetical protein